MPNTPEQWEQMFSYFFGKLRQWCIVGLALSIYAAHVELSAEENEHYVAFCDLTESISCTAAFTSPYGKAFGLMNMLRGEKDAWHPPPNGVIGVFFYTFMIITTFFRNRYIAIIQLSVCLLSNLLSVYLAYILYYILEDLCLVCVSIYIVNFLCFCQSFQNYKLVVDWERRK